MFSASSMTERESERASLAAEVERFLAAGNALQEIPAGVSGVRDGKHAARLFVVNAEPAKPYAGKDRAHHVHTKARSEALDKATRVRSSNLMQERQQLALKAAIHAGLGDSLSATASALGVSRATLRKACDENGIKFQTQA